MTDIIEQNAYPVAIPLIEVGDEVKGGVEGAANKQAIALASRTHWIKLKVETLTAADVSADTKGTASQLMTSHLQDADPHPSYLKIDDAADTYVKLEGANLPNGYAMLDGSGKIPASLLDLADSAYKVVANKAERLALPQTANLTICVQVDEDRLYYLNGNLDPAVEANWFAGQSATVSGVSRVFGRTGEIEAQAGDYTADQITETATRQFVTPEQKTSWGAKQTQLVSGVNIKTFNGMNLLGGGDFNPTPDQLGCAAKIHTHATSDIINLSQLIKDTIGANLVPQGGTTISYDAGSGKTTIATAGGGSGGITLVAEDRLGSLAGQIHNIAMGSIGTYNLMAYALKKEAGSTNQANLVSNFTAGNKPAFNTTGAIIFDNTMKVYHGETKTLTVDGSLYSTSILTDGPIDVTPIISGSVVPNMTANNLPAGYVASAYSVSGANFAAWYAFDGQPASGTNGGDCWAGPWAGMSVSNPIWLRIDLPEAVKLSGYQMQNRGNNENPPKSWKFQGSNDNGTTWTDLDNNVNVATWASAEIRNFTINPSIAYKSYRIAVTAVQQLDRNWVNVAEMKLFPAGGKFLLRKAGVHYTVSDNTLVAVPEGTTVDAAYIEANGMDHLTNVTLNNGQMSMVGNKAYVYKYGYQPGPQIALPKQLFSGKRWESMLKATCNATVVGTGAAFVAVTLDLINYYAWSGSAWVNLGALTNDSASATTLTTSGMTPTVLTNITQAQWALLLTGGVVPDFGFAYGLKVPNTLTDEITISTVIVNVNNAASWKTQTPAEVEMRWYADGVSYKTVTAGDYKLIYQLP